MYKRVSQNFHKQSNQLFRHCPVKICHSHCCLQYCRKPITCSQTIRLEHVQTRRNLHTHEWASPFSGHQEVSAFGDEGKSFINLQWNSIFLENDKQILWKAKYCTFAHSVSISTQVLLLNCVGEGDSGDNWEILCDGRYWMLDDSVQLWHADTNAFLAATGSLYGPPISGQMEIVGSHISDNTCDWTATEGILVPPAGTQSAQSEDERNEL